MQYNLFDHFILRTPIGPITELKEILEQPNIEDFIHDPVFLQSIRLASPSLFQEIEKFKIKRTIKPKDEERLLMSLIKYYSRAHTRCTPFGLFAGVAIGDFDDHNDIRLKEKTKHVSHTRLDMNYLCTLIQDLEKIPDVKMQLRYELNDSLYVFGDKIRYVEYFYQGGRRQHQISGASHNEYLQKIIDGTKQLSSVKDIAMLLVDDEIELEDALGFVEQLIDNQVLVSEFRPPVTGQELHHFIIQKLRELQIENKEVLAVLEKVVVSLEKLDKAQLGEYTEILSEVQEQLSTLPSKFDEKYLFQTDLMLATEKNVIDAKVKEKLIKALKVVNKLSPKKGETALDRFAKRFQERYEERELPLSQVLDTESGIGFASDSSLSGDNCPLVDDIGFAGAGGQADGNISWNAARSMFLNKFIEAKAKGEIQITLTDEDLKDYKEDWNNLSPTFSVMVHALGEGELKYIIGGVGGSSAINLLGRFAHADKDLNDYIQKIAQKEEELNPDKVLAEIVHLPESRIGNILARPVFRDYEIPYLTQSGVAAEEQLTLDDLMVSVKRGMVHLRSKKLNKEVKPHLSHAHNYSANSVPAYHFLCEMQYAGLRPGCFLDLSFLENQFKFKPRVVYEDVILNEATWVVERKDYEDITKMKDDQEIYDAIQKLREKLNIPEEVVLADSDNELYIDLKNPIGVKLLMSLIMKRPSFVLKEFLFSTGDDALVKDESKRPYTNEMVFAFYRNDKQE